MKIIIVGCGKVGTALAAQLSSEGHNVTIIDTNESLLASVSLVYDIMPVPGNGLSSETLREAGLEDADLLIAVTKNDEINMLCCVVAKRSTTIHTIARVRSPLYRGETEFLRKKLGIDMIINPEHAAAKEVARLLQFPSATDIDSFFNNKIDMIRFRVPRTSKIVGTALKDLPRRESNVLICAAADGDKAIIPDGEFVIRGGSDLSIIAGLTDAESFIKKAGVDAGRVRSAAIIGGGELAYYLAEMLSRIKISVTLVERNPKRANELSGLLPDCKVICGDGGNKELLKEEDIGSADAIIVCTDIDEENIILSLYARRLSPKKIVTKINHLDMDDVIADLDLDSIVNPKHTTVEQIIQYVRALTNSQGSNVEMLYKLMGDRFEALEFTVREGCRAAGKSLKDIKTKDNTLVAGILHDGQFIIPGGQDQFMPGDSVVVVTIHRDMSDLDDILDS